VTIIIGYRVRLAHEMNSLGTRKADAAAERLESDPAKPVTMKSGEGVRMCKNDLFSGELVGREVTLDEC
jgi:hypothetical protein